MLLICAYIYIYVSDCAVPQRYIHGSNVLNAAALFFLDYISLASAEEIDFGHHHFTLLQDNNGCIRPGLMWSELGMHSMSTEHKLIKSNGSQQFCLQKGQRTLV